MITEEKISKIHKTVTKRFINENIVIDYTDKSGIVVRPTAEECAKPVPNAFGWWTQIENGAFFTGLYIAGLCDRIKLDPNDDEAKKLLKDLCSGMFQLQDVGSIDGFIARGFADDGRSHYPFGSPDQAMPWVYSLWKLWSQDWVDAELKAELRTRLLREIRAIRNNGWNLPSDIPGRFNGWLASYNMREAGRFLWMIRVAEQLEPDADWHEVYMQLATEKSPELGLDRAQICEGGSVVERHANRSLYYQFWIYTCSQLGMTELFRAETDPVLRERYRIGCEVSSADALKCSKEFFANYLASPLKDAAFDIDWRKLNTVAWSAERVFANANDMAIEQCRYWLNNLSPRRIAEHDMLTQAAFAAWCGIMSPDERVAEESGKQLEYIIENVDCDECYLPVCAWIECGWYAYQLRKKEA